jgi:bacterioferritin (cytochrome b1)
MPQPPDGVVDALQTAVRMHLTAIEHYQTQAEHFARWGYGKLAAAFAEDAEEERGHLKMALGRLEYYDVAPEMDHPSPEWPRHDFEGVLAANMTLEDEVAGAERAAILACRAAGDELSALVFAELLKGSEASIAEIEATQRVIEQIGLDNYLANQVTA